jgi:hypothetical protein
MASTPTNLPSELDMLDLPAVLKRCREIIRRDYPLSETDLVASIDHHLTWLEHLKASRPQAVEQEQQAAP